VSDSAHIEDLRRRLQKDPASIAFAQLAEEYRRAGRFQDAIETARAGLKRHAGYLSARVTLARSLLDAGELDAAQAELNDVLRAAPQNLAAVRGLAEVYRRRGELPEALEQYRMAFELAQNDPGIDQIIRALRRELSPLSGLASPTPRVMSTAPPPASPSTSSSPAGALVPGRTVVRPALTATATAANWLRESAPTLAPDPSRVRAGRVVLALERWLEAILTERRIRIYGLQS
jgi:tetratricopeptide (TPR) repeat protein